MIGFYCHSGSRNHGCEALVRSTIKILENPSVVLFSYFPEEDTRYRLDEIADVRGNGKKMRKYEPYHFLSSFAMRVFGNVDLYCAKVFCNLLRDICGQFLAFSIGGDNYCYPFFPAVLASLNRSLNRAGGKTILWGCSIEPDLLKDMIVRDLKRYSLITTRESITYHALLKAGVNRNTKLYPDPAFTLDTVRLPFPVNFAENNIVGINTSPLIMKYAQNQNVAWENYRQLVQHILQSTDMQIALIPHVVQQNNDDRLPLRALYDEFRDSGRVVMIEDHNCMELKGYISRCRFFIAARTHASIAAYSTCVPTLVIGYSVKAKGIAKDIFGTYEHYVIPVQSLQKVDDLVAAFQWLMEHEEDIRQHLQKFMPSYCAKAWEAGKEIQKLIGEDR